MYRGSIRFTSYSMFSHVILSYLILYYLILSYLTLSYLILSSSINGDCQCDAFSDGKAFLASLMDHIDIGTFTRLIKLFHLESYVHFKSIGLFKAPGPPMLFYVSIKFYCC